MDTNSILGCVYKIIGAGYIYIGSTIQPLYERKASHKSAFKTWSKLEQKTLTCGSYLILELCDDWTIEIVEKILTTSKKTELYEAEQKWIEYFSNENIYVVANLVKAYRSKEEHRKYQRDWATKDRREKGIEPKKHLTEAEHKKYAAEWMAQKRASMTAEEKEEELAKRRANKKPQTEEQKANAKERAKMQRLAIKADPDALAKAREYKRLKAQEYRLKK